MDNWGPDRKVGGNQTGFWVLLVFRLCRLRKLVPLVMLNACLTFSWPSKVPFDHEASGII
jgi:hypothetical protein